MNLLFNEGAMRIVIAGGGKEHSSGIVRKIDSQDFQIVKFNGYSNFKKFLKNVQSEIDEIKPHIIIWMVNAEKVPILNRPEGSLLLYGTYVGHRENWQIQRNNYH